MCRYNFYYIKNLGNYIMNVNSEPICQADLLMDSNIDAVEVPTRLKNRVQPVRNRTGISLLTD